MTTFLPTATFRDPVHGFIDVYEWEKRIVDSEPFQRLRRIHQTGLTYYIYHGAEHTRFGHSLGVMHLAGRMVQRLIVSGRDTLGWSENEAKSQWERLFFVARLAGLLHDIGHAPFSHVGERLLFPPGTDHEAVGAAIIESPTLEIQNVLDNTPYLNNLEINSALIASVIRGQALEIPEFVREVVSSVYDVDKMDYLLRDSQYCGVEYGKFDLGRLLDTFTLYDDPEKGVVLAIEDGGLHALEGFILARYFMFTQVYFHSIRRAYDLVLASFIGDLLQEETGLRTYPKNVVEYLKWDDHRVLDATRPRADPIQKNFAWRIRTRQHPKVVYETPENIDSHIRRRAFVDLKGELERQFPGMTIWRDQSSDHPDRFRKDELSVKKPGLPPFWRDLTTESLVLRGLQEIDQVRVFADVRGNAELEDRVRQFCVQFMARG